MAVPPANALWIQLLEYHDNENLVLHIQQLTKVCVINGKNTNHHKLQYFPNSLKGRAIDWFGKYETTHSTTTCIEVQCAFITWFSEIKSEGQATITLQYAKQKKYELMEDYYDRFLWLCATILQQLNNIYLWETFIKRLWTKMKMVMINMLRKN
jgi:hypothetical protein